MDRRADVMVIGAGLAGLSTAHLLMEHGFEVIVLEAKDRVGGRLLTQTVAGNTVDAGGSWVGPPQREILKLVERLGLSTFAQHDAGRHILVWNGRHKLFTGDTPPIAWAALIDAGQAIWRLDRAARRMKGSARWSSAQAQHYDRQTFGAWLRRNTHTTGARFLFETVTLPCFGCLPDELSLLGFLVHIGSAGGMGPMIGGRGAALDAHIAGGAAKICEELSRRLGPRVRLNAPVTAIDQSANDVRIVTTIGEFHSRRSVLAVDSATAGWIDHRPPLPQRRAGLEHSFTMGSGVKAHFCYDEPFWRRRGLSGQSYANNGVVRITYDVGPPSGPGILTTFLGHQLPEQAAAIDGPPERRRDAALADLVARFGDEARHPIGYVEHNWAHEPFQSGCVPRPAPGVITSAQDSITRPIGNLHFAGAETSEVWEGHMDGAVHSAHRVVAELLSEQSDHPLLRG